VNPFSSVKLIFKRLSLILRDVAICSFGKSVKTAGSEKLSKAVGIKIITAKRWLEKCMLSTNLIGGFDPFGWLEKWIPGHLMHFLIRLGVIAIAIVFLIHRIARYHNFLVKPLWAVETFIFFAILISYAIRTEPWERSRGIKEIVIPLIGAVTPFALLLTPPSPWTYRNIYGLYAVFYWMTANTALTLWGIWTLRRSFSITVEVRTLVTNGPYRWLRHPIYIGEILTAGGVLVWRFSLRNLVIFLIFVIIQILRAGWEEDKLKKYFPDYRQSDILHGKGLFNTPG
jgi:protein-S-isoprenylcysteine O-methyltransferase Ste14